MFTVFVPISSAQTLSLEEVSVAHLHNDCRRLQHPKVLRARDRRERSDRGDGNTVRGIFLLGQFDILLKINFVMFRTTPLRNNKHYVMYYVFWSKVILVEVVPYMLIIFLNLFMIRTIAVSDHFRKTLRPVATAATGAAAAIRGGAAGVVSRFSQEALNVLSPDAGTRYVRNSFVLGRDRIRKYICSGQST